MTTSATGRVLFDDFEGAGGPPPRLGVRVTLVAAATGQFVTAKGAFRRFAVAQFFASPDGGPSGWWTPLLREDGAAVTALYQDTDHDPRWTAECVASATAAIRDERRARDFHAQGVVHGAGDGPPA